MLSRHDALPIVLYHQHRKMGIEVARACTRPRTYTEDRDKLGKRENIVSQTMTAAEQTSKASARGRTSGRAVEHPKSEPCSRIKKIGRASCRERVWNDG